MKRRSFLKLSATSGLSLYMGLPSFARVLNEISASENELVLAFQKATGPRPYTFWQWMNGCVTKEGITYDLEAFKKAGINDVQQFLVGGSESDVTDPSVIILEEKWLSLMRFALDECHRLGMTFGTHNCPGWSSSGAPGMKVEDSMKKLVWAKNTMKAGQSIILPKPEVDTRWNFYRDICVIAFPTGKEVITSSDVHVFKDVLIESDQFLLPLNLGDCEVIRIGYTTNGHINSTAPLTGQGFEVDKMSKDALEVFWKLYPEKLIKMAGDHAGKVFKRLEVDSFEAGFQDWTANMPEDFKRIAGYELDTWLVTLTGQIINSKEETDRFRYDFQKVINTLVSENYYGHMNTLVHKVPGMEFMMEPYGTGRINFDPLAIRGIGDIVMCEFWWGPTTWGWDSIMPVASNAHINGKKIVAAEAFTAQPQYAWQVDLFGLKQAGDKAFCRGVNLMVFHASAHQPWPHLKPGMTMGWWGTQFGPSQTWWNHGAAEWIDYLSRCQMLLQQGQFVADICFLQLRKQKDPVIPAGYKADLCSEREFVDRFEVKNGRWVLPDGMSYKLLVLPANFPVTNQVAKKIVDCVESGGVILGRRFLNPAGLQTSIEETEVIATINNTLFGTTKETKRNVGKGRVYFGLSVEEVLEQESVFPDVAYTADKDIEWIHREKNGCHYYFVSNQKGIADNFEIQCRVKGFTPEIWNPETGETFPVLSWEQQQHNIKINLYLEGYGSRFIVFRKTNHVQSSFLSGFSVNGKLLPIDRYLLNKNGVSLIRLSEPGNYKIEKNNKVVAEKIQKHTPVIIQLNNHWQLTFEEHRGAPSTAHFDSLISWTDHQDEGIKYFSGTAVYSRTFELKKDYIAAAKAIFLNLGTVKNTARVIVNGKTRNYLWKPPFELDITAFCKAGINSLEIEVTNLWPNRIIGDKVYPDDCIWGEKKTFTYVKPEVVIGRNLQEIPEWVANKTTRLSKDRVTFSTFDFFEPTTPLLPSGLLGPVTISVEEIWAINNILNK